jgi:hypothetical protein
MSVNPSSSPASPMNLRALLGVFLLAVPAHASLWWHGETGWWGPSPEGRRYQLTEERANGLPGCEAKCAALGGTPVSRAKAHQSPPCEAAS